MKRTFEEGIMALIPSYGMKGENCTEVYTMKGEKKLIYNKLDTVLNNYVNSWGKELKWVRNYAKSKLNHKNLMPLVLSEERVLIPIKVRKTVAFADGSYGYFSLSEIKYIEDEEGGAVITFSNHTKIKTKMCAKKIKDKILEGNYIREIYDKKMKEVKKQYAIGKKLADLSQKTDLMENVAIFEFLLKEVCQK